MPYFLTLVGLIMVVTAAKGSHAALGQQLSKDFTGPGNFIYWFIAIGVIGAISKIPGGEKVAKPFLFLLLGAMILAQQRGTSGGFFVKFMNDVRAGPIAPAKETTTASGTPQENSAGIDTPIGKVGVKEAVEVGKVALMVL